MSRYAASWLYGAAPAARVINIAAAVTDKDGTGLVESKIILAFQIILAHFETGECTSGKTIVNFSWSLGMAGVKETSSIGIVHQSRTLLLEGAFLVAAAGNDSVGFDIFPSQYRQRRFLICAVIESSKENPRRIDGDSGTSY